MQLMLETRDTYTLDDFIPADANPSQVKKMRSIIFKDTVIEGGDGTSIEKAIVIKGPPTIIKGKPDLIYVHPIKLQEMWCACIPQSGEQAVGQQRLNPGGRWYDEIEFEKPDGSRYKIYFDVTESVHAEVEQSPYDKNGLINALKKMEEIALQTRSGIISALKAGDIKIVGGDGLAKEKAIAFVGDISHMTGLLLERTWHAAYAEEYRWHSQELRIEPDGCKFDKITVMPPVNDSRIPMRSVFFDVTSFWDKF